MLRALHHVARAHPVQSRADDCRRNAHEKNYACQSQRPAVRSGAVRAPHEKNLKTSPANRPLRPHPRPLQAHPPTRPPLASPLGRHCACWSLLERGCPEQGSASGCHLLPFAVRPLTKRTLCWGGRPRALTTRSRAGCAGQKSVVRPPFQVQHLRPSQEPIFVSITQELTSQLLRDHPQAPTLSFLSDIIKTPYTPYRSPVPALRLPTASASKRPEPPARLFDLPLSPFPLRLAPLGPSISTEGCGARRWEIVS